MTGTQGFGAYVSVTEIDTQDKTRGLCNITMVVTQPDLVASQQLHTTQTNNLPGMISVALLHDKYSNTCQRVERKKSSQAATVSLLVTRD